MRCICIIRKEMIEPGLNLENQECHSKDELISVEIDVKITGIGCTFGNGKQNKYGTGLR